MINITAFLFTEFNAMSLWGILLATIVSYLLGAIWYMPKVFGNLWMQSLGKNRDELGDSAKPLIMTFFTTAITATVMYFVLFVLKSQGLVNTVWDGVYVGFIFGLGIYGVTAYSDSLFCGWPIKVIAIQVAYRICQMMLIGLLLVSFM